jgi:hypothetical protein
MGRFGRLSLDASSVQAINSRSCKFPRSYPSLKVLSLVSHLLPSTIRIIEHHIGRVGATVSRANLRRRGSAGLTLTSLPCTYYSAVSVAAETL